MKILFVVGSLRKNSFNRQLAEHAAKLLSGSAEVSFLDYADVPFMNQDIESPVPDSVARVRNDVILADGIWFFTPEYNHSYPALLKNLLDWLSRPLIPGDYSSGTAIAGKKVALSGAAGKSAASFSMNNLRELLKQIKVDVLPLECGIAISPESWQTNVLTLTEEDKVNLSNEAEAFLNFLSDVFNRSI